jgi:hypothetical protein
MDRAALAGFLRRRREEVAALAVTSAAPPRTEGYEKLQLLAVLGQQRFDEARPAS